MARRYVPDAGDIVWLDFRPQVGHEQAGHRPALVLTPAAYNSKTSLMICCPLTTRIKNYPFEVSIGGTPPSAVLADQVKSLDWLMVHAGRITGVIDFSCVGVGDPACDSVVAWAFLSAHTRNIFRATLGVDDVTWKRGRGWALSTGLILVPYYQNTNPVLAATGRKMIAEVLADFIS